MSDGLFIATASAKTLAEQAREIAERAGALAEEAVAIGSGGAAVATAGIDPFVFQLAIFVLTIFVGYYVVWSVTPALHTPLMAVTNAISSVIIVGALLATGIQAAGFAATSFGFIALVLAAVNIVGGFLVTQRMLAMYKKKER
ncbi:MAG: NAD(P) transhydrogenase subunit alpha [Rhizobiaceae bacterium]|nr:NAD(P) transhydrogenase subunit alpha [Rhizobiaceae bacterium]MBL4732643.1 NAD(P) transhydrogenase subunit alpha [Rhizobiaceae bacterium]